MSILNVHANLASVLALLGITGGCIFGLGCWIVALVSRTDRLQEQIDELKRRP